MAPMVQKTRANMFSVIFLSYSNNQLMMTHCSLNDKVPLDCMMYYGLTIIIYLFFLLALCKHGKTSIVSALSVRFGVRSVCFSLKCSFSLDCDIEIFFL